METLDVDLKASDEEALKKVDEKIYTIEDFLNEKIRLYGQSLLTNSTYKLFSRKDKQILKRKN